MARGTPTFFSGTVATNPAGNVVQAIREAIETELQAYDSNATTAWATYDTVTATADRVNRVYRSVGDRNLVSGAGDAHLLFRMQQISDDDIEFNVYQDWSTTSNTGTNGAGGATTRWLSLDLYSEARYWGAVNEYEFVFLLLQAQKWYYIHIGSPIRSHVPTGAAGIAFTTASASSGSSVTVNLDRDITASIVDSGDIGGPQNVWIYNVTPTATALRTGTIEIAEVTTIASGSITFANLSNSFDSGAIVGLDPCPQMVTESASLASGGSIDVSLYFTSSIAAGYTSSTAQLADYEPFLSPTQVSTPVPDSGGFIIGSRAGIQMDQSGLVGFRGTSELVAFVRTGNMLDTDFWRPNFSAANQYMVFPSIILAANGPALAIGPGAT